MAAFAYEAISPHSADVLQMGTVPQKMASGETFKAGAPLGVNASNEVVELSADFTSGLLFIAYKDAPTDGTLDIDVWPVFPNSLWEASLEDALTLADVTEAYGLKKDGTTSIWIIDEAETEDQVRILHRIQDPAGADDSDTGGRVIITFADSVISGN